ncbi:MAG: beta-propeller fold lactonase family protein [Candidatus Eremiobacterota bacterium]
MLKKAVRIFTLIFCLNLCMKFLVLSQESVSGVIHGIVQDKMMKGIKDVEVEIVEADKICHTDETGCFYFDDLESGYYTMCFSMDDYQTQRKSITLQKGQTRYLIVDMYPIEKVPPVAVSPEPLNHMANNTSIMYPVCIPVGLNPDLSNPMESASVYLLYVACAGWSFGEEIYNSNDITHPFLAVSKKKNVLMIINSLSRSAVNIIEWKDTVMPGWLAMKDGKILYIADTANNITVLDTEKNNSVVTVIPMEEHGYSIGDITTGNGGKNLYCTWAHLETPLLKVLDTTTNTYVKTIPLPALKDNSIGQPWAIAAHGQTVYVSLGTAKNGEVVFINTVDNTVEDTVTVGENPYGLAITPDGKKLYVANRNSNSISVIDVLKKEVTNTIKAGLNPTKVTITPDGKKLFVARMGCVSIIDTATDALMNTLASGSYPACIAISGDGKFAFVTNSGSNDITIIDVAKNTVVSRTIAFYGGRPFGIVVK